MSLSLPLRGLVVVELGTSVAGPVGCQILADLGAEVVKIENPGSGDDARSWGPPFVNGNGSVFYAVNRNKHSAAVDLKNDVERTQLRRFIINKADIVLQNMRPGLVNRYKLDAATLRAEKPSLIYCNLGAFGSTGPLRERAGYDPLMQAFAGIMSVTGEEGREPVRVGPSIIDQGTGMWAVIGILAALHQRHATGIGCEVNTSLFEAGLAWVITQVASYYASGRIPGRIGSENASIAPYKAYHAKDGWLVIAAGNDNLFIRLASALGRPDWASNPDFRTNSDRVKNRAAVNALVAQAVSEHTRDHLIDVLDRAGVPAAPLLDIEEVLQHPQTKSVEMIQASPDGGIPTVGIPLQFDGARPPFRSSAPSLGAHTSRIAEAETNSTTVKDRM